MRISKQEDDMILSDRTMDKMIKEGTLVVKPITEGQIQPFKYRYKTWKHI